MKALLVLALAASAYCTVSRAAGFSSLTVYSVSGGAGLWQNFIDKRQEFEDNGGAVRGINCVANDLFYLMGAAAAFGAGQYGAMYIQNQGMTTQGKHDSFRNVTTTRSWHWPTIHSVPEGLHNLLAQGLPGSVAGHA